MFDWILRKQEIKRKLAEPIIPRKKREQMAKEAEAKKQEEEKKGDEEKKREHD